MIPTHDLITQEFSAGFWPGYPHEDEIGLDLFREPINIPTCDNPHSVTGDDITIHALNYVARKREEG